MSNRREDLFDIQLPAPRTKRNPFELFTVVSDEAVRYAESANDVAPYKLEDMVTGD